ncbi:restriction endonuclease subunit M [Natrialbaceae archaeon A-CW2]
MAKPGHEVPDGYIRDYLTGKTVEDTESEEARQILGRRLVEEYQYDKSKIGIDVSVPKLDRRVDIVVYEDQENRAPSIVAVTSVEEKKDGKSVIKTALGQTAAEIGIWFNGEERYCVHQLENDEFEHIPDIPKLGDSLDDIGVYKYDDLVPAPDLKNVFDIIYYHLYSNSEISRAERLGPEMIRLLFCKLYDEKSNSVCEFVTRIDESPEEVAERIRGLFSDVKKTYPDAFDSDERLVLSPSSIRYVVSELQRIGLTKTNRDAVGDAFEVFIGPSLRGDKGQFFTPQNVVDMCVEIVDPDPNDEVLDPACGSGRFLISALETMRGKVQTDGGKYQQDLTSFKQFEEEDTDSDSSEPDTKTIPAEEVEEASASESGESSLMDVPSKNIYGIDKDFDLAKISKAYMAIAGNGSSQILCENSLNNPSSWDQRARNLLIRDDELRKFDVILTNPPFGSKIPIKSKEILENYELGYKWNYIKKREQWEQTKQLLDGQAPQVLFIERCLDMLKPGGKMAIVLPDGILGNQTNGHIRQYIMGESHIIAIIDCPLETFLPGTSTKTSVLVLQKKGEHIEPPESVFMAIAEKCGHDRRGNPITEDDFPEIVEEYNKFKSES